ncbi:MAG: ABC transporter, permease protein (cluster 13, osmolytes), partial [uncultured Thermoleophilia bacterium]
ELGVARAQQRHGARAPRRARADHLRGPGARRPDRAAGRSGRVPLATRVPAGPGAHAGPLHDPLDRAVRPAHQPRGPRPGTRDHRPHDLLARDPGAERGGGAARRPAGRHRRRHRDGLPAVAAAVRRRAPARGARDRGRPARRRRVHHLAGQRGRAGRQRRARSALHPRLPGRQPDRGLDRDRGHRPARAGRGPVHRRRGPRVDPLDAGRAL